MRAKIWVVTKWCAPKKLEKTFEVYYIKEETKEHSLSDYLRYMHLIDDGYSFHYISDHYGSGEKSLKVLWQRKLFK